MSLFELMRLKKISDKVKEVELMINEILICHALKEYYKYSKYWKDIETLNFGLRNNAPKEFYSCFNWHKKEILKLGVLNELDPIFYEEYEAYITNKNKSGLEDKDFLLLELYRNHPEKVKDSEAIIDGKMLKEVTLKDLIYENIEKVMSSKEGIKDENISYLSYFPETMSIADSMKEKCSDKQREKLSQLYKTCMEKNNIMNSDGFKILV